jgi:hypothetical protein
VTIVLVTAGAWGWQVAMSRKLAVIKCSDTLESLAGMSDGSGLVVPVCMRQLKELTTLDIEEELKSKMKDTKGGKPSRG